MTAWKEDDETSSCWEVRRVRGVPIEDWIVTKRAAGRKGDS